MEFEKVIPPSIAILISLISLIFAILEGRKSRKHNRLSVKPILTFSLFVSKAYDRYSLIIKNNGIGPAQIKTFEMLVDGKTFQGLKDQNGIENWEDLSSYLKFPDRLDWHYIDKEAVIKAGNVVEIVGFKYTTHSAELASRFRQSVRRLKISVLYTSIYEIDSFKAEYDGDNEIKKE